MEKFRIIPVPVLLKPISLMEDWHNRPTEQLLLFHMEM
jgi:hypothetical protein